MDYRKLLDQLGIRKLLGLIVVLATAVGGIVIVVDDNGPDRPPGQPRHRVTITLGGPGQKKVELPPVAQSVAKEQAAQEAKGQDEQAHADLRKEPPLASSPAVVQANDAKTPKGQPELPVNPPLAAVNAPGCRTLLVRNFSSRNGSPILIFVIHYTVSLDSGWAGVLGNVKWFDSSASQASSNYIVDRKIGACALTVAEASKSWAQAGYNRVALSVEVTATGKEGTFFPKGPGRDRIVALIRRAHKVYRLPYRHGAVADCKVVRTGFVIHKDLGACGGGHVDTSPYGIDDLVAEAARLDAVAARPQHPITSIDRRTCQKLNWWRAHGRPPGKAEANAVRRKAALTKRGVTCTAKGPVVA